MCKAPNQECRSWEWLSAPKTLGGLGFCDLVLFNQAMLARQCWRLIRDPSSLCARVLKGRYYRGCDFWEAPKPRSSSYTWRSILFGKELLQQGLRWGIGNGRTTKLLSDNWVPDLLPFQMKTRISVPEGAKVDLLIDQDHGGWDTNVVRTIF
jgi:hypothetical protein